MSARQAQRLPLIALLVAGLLLIGAEVRVPVRAAALLEPTALVGPAVANVETTGTGRELASLQPALRVAPRPAQPPLVVASVRPTLSDGRTMSHTIGASPVPALLAVEPVARYRWQAFFGELDSGYLTRAELDQRVRGRALVFQRPLGHLDGVGFPEIELSNRPPAERYKPYRPMIRFRTDPLDGSLSRPIANVRCMGLSPQQVAYRADRYDRDILRLAMHYGISAALVKAVTTVESCFDPNARSRVGAIGLMQLMPKTARWLGVNDPDDPLQNLDGGIRYLVMLKDRFKDTTLALAAYNAGPNSVDRFGGVPPFKETRLYVVKVQRHYRRYLAATSFANRDY